MMSSRFCILAPERNPVLPEARHGLDQYLWSILYFIELFRGLYVGNVYLGLSRAINL